MITILAIISIALSGGLLYYDVNMDDCVVIEMFYSIIFAVFALVHDRNYKKIKKMLEKERKKEEPHKKKRKLLKEIQKIDEQIKAEAD
jgi:large-conductance mechanosensitive channel